MNKTIPVFFSSNDRYVPYLDVAIISLVKNTSKENNYEIIVLNTEISKENQEKILKHQTDNVKIRFYDVKEMLEPIKKTLPDMFYYSLAAYFRLFIEKAFPQYEKAIYLDCDVVVLDDIAKLYNTELGDNLVGAVYEQNSERGPEFSNYVDTILGIPYKTYFNSGVMVMNLSEFRKFGVQDRFLNMLTTYNFDSLAPDQEYINAICHGRVKYLPNMWNKHSLPLPLEGDRIRICHYAMANKPWHYQDVLNGEYFWEYAKYSSFYEQLKKELENYSDADKQRDFQMFMSIKDAIEQIKHSERTFKKLWFDKQKA